MSESAQQGSFGLANVQAKWESQSSPEGVFCDQFHVIRAGGLYYVTFGQVVMPIITNQDEAPSSVAIQPMTRVIIPDAAAKQLRVMLEANLPPEAK